MSEGQLFTQADLGPRTVTDTQEKSKLTENYFSSLDEAINITNPLVFV